MSKISTVHDALLTALGTLFSTKNRIPDAYNLQFNSDQFLRDGYGLRTDFEAPAESEFNTFSRSRTFAVVLTREVLRTGMQTSQMDTEVKLLLEDVYVLQKDFMNPDQIGIEASIEKIDMFGTSGVTSFIGEQTNFITMEVMFQIQITDNI